MYSFYRISFLFVALLMCGINFSMAQWRNITPHGSQVDFLSVVAIPNGSSGTYLFAAGVGTGVTLSTNNGTTWTAKNTGLNGATLQTLAASGTTLYAGTLQNGAFYSTDYGTTWAQVDSGLPKLVPGSSYDLPIMSLGFSGNNIFAGTEYVGGIYQHNSAKTVWTNTNTVLSAWVSSFLTVSDTELLATTYSGILVSKDHGQTWPISSSGMGKDTAVECVATVPNSSGGTTILAGISLANGNADGGILASTDGGHSWSKADSGIENYFLPGIYESVNALAVSGTSVFAAMTGSGLYFSNNQGKFWTRVDNQGLSDSTFEGLLVYHDTLYVAGFEGVYCRPLSQLTAVKENRSEIPLEFSLSQNYPNPFNPSTMIQFTVPSNGHAVLKIFNVLGQEVATLFNGEATTGVNHQVEFNASNLASGIYFSRLEFDGKSQMKKMLLLK